MTQKTPQTLEEEMDDYHARATFVPNPPKNKSDLGIVMGPLMLGMVLYLIAGDSNALSPETLTVLDGSGDAIAQTLQVTSEEIASTIDQLKLSSQEEIMVLAEQAKEVPTQMKAALMAGTAALAAGIYNAKDFWGDKLASVFDKTKDESVANDEIKDSPAKK